MRYRVLALLTAALLFVAPTLANGHVELELLGTYATGIFDEGAAEIAAYDPATQNLFVVDGNGDIIDIINVSDPSAPTKTGELALEGGPNSVAVFNGIVAVASEGEETDSAGMVEFFSTSGDKLAMVTVGVLPDMLTFTPDGSKVLTANEGEPNDDYSVDPEGSISIIDLSGGVETLTDANVTTLSFGAYFEANGVPEGVRVYGPNATPAQDMEPEYIAITPDGATAYVTLQENNALAVIDIASASVSAILGLGFKDHSLDGNGMDASNEDGAINIRPWPVLGMYQPDAIVAVELGGTVYLVTANEGDTRDYDGYSEEGEVSEITLDETAFPNAAELQPEAELGKLEITIAHGDSDGDGDFDQLYVPGARSFTIWGLDGTVVWDSGDQLERITAEAFPDDFNATNDENGSFDDRSDNKGPEPEGLAIGVVGDKTVAFVGLERIGGVVLFDISDPTAPVFMSYNNNRDFSGDPQAGTAGDLGPEGILFISAADSPTGAPLLVVANEISGSTSIFAVVEN